MRLEGENPKIKEEGKGKIIEKETVGVLSNENS